MVSVLTSHMEDVVCVCLGCNSLLLLAQYRNNQYKLGRPLFIHGFHDAIAFLGLREKSCEGVLVNDDDGSRRVYLRNIETEKETVHDPRPGFCDVGLYCGMSNELTMD
jgi:hypothetical protein